MNEAFTFKALPDGGVCLSLNLARTAFSVNVSQEEIKTIRKRVEDWHRQMHAQGTSTAMGFDVLDGHVRSAVMGCAMKKMEAVTPPGLMGAVAKAALTKRIQVKKSLPVAAAAKVAQQKIAVAAKKIASRPAESRPTAPTQKKIDPAAIKAVQKALLIVTDRRAKYLSATKRKQAHPNAAEVSEGKNFARQHFTKMGIPSDMKAAPFWFQPTKVIANKAAAAVNAATTQGAPVKPPVVAQKVVPVKMAIVKKGLSTVAQRRARFLAFQARKKSVPNPVEVNQGQAFANEFFTKSGIPVNDAPAPFWNQNPPMIQAAVAKIMKEADAKGAPAKTPQPVKVDRSKLREVEKGIKVVALRRARFLMNQAKRKHVSPDDVKAGNAFAKDFFVKNEIPTTSSENPFWNQTLPLVATKVNSTVKLAEAQGAPPKPPAPAKPIAIKVDQQKVAIIRRGLLRLAGQRARFLAFQRQSKVATAADMQAGKDYARKIFMDKGIPVKLPGRSSFIAGWAVDTYVGQTAGAALDPTTEFWAKPAPEVAQKIEDAIKAVAVEAPPTLAREVPMEVKAPDGVTPPEGTPSPTAPAPAGGAPGDMPAGGGPAGAVAPEDNVPGDAPGNMEYPPPAASEPPGYLPDSAATEAQAAPEDVPGQMYYEQEPAGYVPLSDSYEEPGSVAMAPDEAPGDYAEATQESFEEIPGEVPDFSEEPIAYNEEVPEEIPDFSEEPIAYNEEAEAVSLEEEQPEQMEEAMSGYSVVARDSLVGHMRAKIIQLKALAAAGNPAAKQKLARLRIKALARRAAKARAAQSSGATTDIMGGLIKFGPITRGPFKKYHQGVLRGLK